MSERHLIRTTVNVLCLKGGKVLLSRRANTGWADGMLVIPGGHVEPGETPTQAAIREVKEELGLTIDRMDLQFYCVAARKTGAECVAYEFLVKLKEDQVPTNTEPASCSELVWVEADKLPDDLVQDFADIISNGFLQKQQYLELGYN